MRQEYGASFVTAFDSGRTALAAVLEAAQLPRGSMVAVQAFTCVAVPNAVRAAQLMPCYVDIDSSLNMSVTQLERALQTHDNRIAAVIVQHTFGVPADMVQITALCRSYGVVLIEDCAHALGASVNGQPVGSFGDAAIFSFGRDKMISTVSGGVAITRRSDIGQQLHRLWKGRRYPSPWWIAQRLFHPIAFAFALPFYRVKIGVAVIAFLRHTHILPLVLNAQERHGVQPEGYRYPSVLARWAVRQLQQLKANNQIRRSFVASYQHAVQFYSVVNTQQVHSSSQPVYLRYAAFVPEPIEMKNYFRSRGILLGDWYDTPIAPRTVTPNDAGYSPESCPAAERAALHVVNLPTQPSMTNREYQLVLNTLHEYLTTTYGTHTA